MDFKGKLKAAAITICLIIFISSIFIFQQNKYNNDPIKAGKGVFDLSMWNKVSDPTIKLDGEWEFYWNKLISPDDFKGINAPIKTGYMNMPSIWKEGMVGQTKIEPYGCATYRLVIKNADPKQVYAVRISNMFTSYKLWANGILIAQDGIVGLTDGDTVPEYKTETAMIHNSDNQIELVLQVANFQHRVSSSWSIIFGLHDTIFQGRYYSIMLEAFLFGATLIMGFYFLETYLIRKKEKSNLFFSMLCFIMAVRTIMVGERIFSIIFPGFNWQLYQKIVYLSLYLLPPVFTAFIKELYPEEISRGFSYIILYICCALSITVLLTPHKIYDYTLSYFEVLAVILIVYLLFGLVRAVLCKKEGSGLILLSAVFLSTTVINDMLFDRQYVSTRYLLPVGLFFMVVCQTFILTRRFSNAFSKQEELLKINTQLIEDIKEEKEALESEMQNRLTAEKLLSQAVQYDKLKSDFFANMSHEFRTPINVLLSSIQMCSIFLKNNENETDIEKLNKYLGIMKQNCFRLLRLVNNLIDITKIDAGYYKLSLCNCNIINVVEEITMSVAEYIRDKGIELVFDTDVEEKITACDPEIIERIILNLLSNAVKFTKPGGSIFVTVNSYFDRVKISVRDTGIGIPEDKLEMIFERFVQVDKSLSRNHEGSGIGLSLVRSLVEMHGGTVKVLSTLGKGSEFIVELPVIIVPDKDLGEPKQFSEADPEKVSVEFSDIY